MSEITATGAARSFAGLLDAVEHRRERFTIVRRGKTVASLEPITEGHGADVKEAPSPSTRHGVVAGPGRRAIHSRDRESVLTRVLFDTAFLVDAERSGSALDDAVGDDDEVAIAAITAAELRVGALLSSGRIRAARLAFLEDILRVIPVLDYDRTVAEVACRPARSRSTPGKAARCTRPHHRRDGQDCIAHPREHRSVRFR